MEEVFTFPSSFFFRIVTPLNLEELNGLASSHTILLTQDLDRVLGIGQISFERCHFRQYNILECLQALLLL
jgi:hypothetical protein